MEALEEPDERVDEQDPEEDLDPFVRQGAGEAIGRPDIHLGCGQVEGNIQGPGIMCRLDQRLDGLAEVREVPAIHYLRIER